MSEDKKKEQGKDYHFEFSLSENSINNITLLDKIDSLLVSIPKEVPEIKCKEVTRELISLMKLKTEVPVSTGIMVTEHHFIEKFDELITKIIKEDIRIMYHLITSENKRDEDKDEDWKDALIINTAIILELIAESDGIEKAENEDEKELIKKKKKIMLKIYDHYQLLITQQSDLVEAIKRLEKIIEATEENIANQDKETLRKIDEQVKSTKIDQISILGVFTGVSFITFGGLSLVSDAAEVAKNGAFNYIDFTYVVLLIGLILINSLVILMQYIRSMTDSNVRVRDVFWDGKSKLMVYINVAIISVLVLLIISMQLSSSLSELIQQLI